MSFRGKLLALFTAAMVLAVGLVAVIVSGATRRAFERADEQRTDALVAQFRREFARRGDEVSGRVAALAGAEPTLRMAIELGGPTPDPAPYVNEAASMAASQQLDFLEVVAGDGAIISSALKRQVPRKRSRLEGSFFHLRCGFASNRVGRGVDHRIATRKRIN